MLSENMIDSLKVVGVCCAAITIPPILEALRFVVAHNEELRTCLYITSLAYILWKWYRDIKKDKNEQPPKKD